MAIEKEFKLVHDGVRYLAKATGHNEEMPRKLQTEVREILEGNSSADIAFSSGNKEYIGIDVDGFNSVRGDDTVGIVRYNDTTYDVYGVTVYDNILSDFGVEF